ncbi:MAG: hypothetical protein CMH48_02595 [Muricauda sp.]|nr:MULTISPECIES: hypothetical protein [Allomuricauda]MAU27369.1 hypothetical protein [Allomuricauda sp.]MBC29709.1 hypothetical protein [Allomuricauda sp.]
MKQVGIWIDKEKAYIVTLSKDSEAFETVNSEVEFFHPKGGSRSKTRWGPQEVVQDSKYLEREKHQMQRYFNNIVPYIEKAEEIAIFGPADTGQKFNKFLESKNQALAKKVKNVQKADSMTHNQIKALARDFFASK